MNIATIYFSFFLVTLSCYNFAFSQESIASEQAYDKAQALRDEAGALLVSKTDESLKEAETILLSALGFVRQPNILAMYQDNIYLAGRQWDILRDLIKVKSIQKDKHGALQYLNEMLETGNLMSWVANDKDVISTLGRDPLFQKSLKIQKSWERIGVSPAFDSNYQTNISDAEKIAGLSQLWSEARQGFVYFDQVPDLDWDKAFKSYIPKVLDTKSTEAYYRELTRLVAQLEDSHTNVYYPNELRSKVYARPPIRTKLIEGKVIVTDIYSAAVRKLGISIGDEVIEIDGQDIHQYANSQVRPFQSASTVQDLNIRTYRHALFSGNSDNEINLTITNKLGNSYTVSIARTGYTDVQYPKPNHFSILKGNIAYFRTNTFSSDEAVVLFEKSLPQIKASKGLIIDIRGNGGGSSDIGYRILKHLSNTPIVSSAFSSRVNKPLSRARGSTWISWSNISAYAENSSHTEPFDKPVAVLASAQTFSAAEDFLIAYRGLNRGIIIGEVTAGSSGQPLAFPLPAGGMARICVKRDKYPNGRDWVGVGIEPDIYVQPKIIDVQNGFDPVLAAAVDIINTQ